MKVHLVRLWASATGHGYDEYVDTQVFYCKSAAERRVEMFKQEMLGEYPYAGFGSHTISELELK